MAGEGSNQKQGTTCRSVFLVGCGLVLLLTITAGFLLVSNWDSIRQNPFVQLFLDLGQRFANESPDILQLRTYLMDKYPCESVGIRIRRTTSKSSDDGVDTLAIEFLNPSFIDGISGANARDQAFDIALDVAQNYRLIEKYDYVTIKFVLRQGTFISFSRGASFGFPIEDLRPMQDLNG